MNSAARTTQDQIMKARPEKMSPTFGEFVVSAYDALGRRQARRAVRLAIKAHWIKFRGRDRFEIS